VYDDFLNGGDGSIDPPSDIFRRGFDAAQAIARSIEFYRETRPIVLHDLKFGLEIRSGPLGGKPAADRGFQKTQGRVEFSYRFFERPAHRRTLQFRESTLEG